MSTYYYLVCDTHRTATGVICGRSFPDRWWWNEAEHEVVDFTREHAGCEPSPRLVSEHDARLEAYLIEAYHS